MPRFSANGFAPAATFRRPCSTIAWASTVAVVVPSPATSLVFLATSLTSWAPMFSCGSSRSISLAIETPSFVIVGAPQLLASTTLRPLGPSVILTALATWSSPRSRARRASASNVISLAVISSPPSLDRTAFSTVMQTHATPARSAPACSSPDWIQRAPQ